jgi:glycosyltransferase involved in cell wall biosynthesis
MRLLFLTQVIDAGDAVLGFTTRWVAGLAERCERVRVIALQVGDLSGLPANVDVREVGRQGRVRRLLRYHGLLREAFRRDGFDTVLAHMIPRYALVAEGQARRAGAGLFLWYTHGGVDARLRRAVPRVDRVFTATPESMRVPSGNTLVTGHGIDLVHFPLAPLPAGPPRLLSVGRLTPAKDALVAVEALGILVQGGWDVFLDLVGAGLVTSDERYRAQVASRVRELGLGARVDLGGAVPYRDIPGRYAAATVVLNPSRTGSLDKVVLEAMATGRPVVSCNEAVTGILSELGPTASLLRFEPGDARGLAGCLERLLALSTVERGALGERLRAVVVRNHDVDRLMARLVREMGARR